MAGCLKPGGFGGGVQRLVKAAFGLGVELKVEDNSACRADQVVVVLGELLGEFVAGEVVIGDDSGHGASLFEQRQVAVDARLRERRVGGSNLGDRQGALAMLQRSDEPAPAFGVALLDGSKQLSDFLVDVGSTHMGNASWFGSGGRAVWSNTRSVAMVVPVVIIDDQFVPDVGHAVIERASQVGLGQCLVG